MAKRKKNREEKNWYDIEWSEGDIKAQKVDSREEIYFLALKGNPLVVRTMDAGDLEAVFKEYQKKMSTRAKEIRKLRKSVAQGTAAIIEIAEEWTTESTALEIATERRVIAGIGQLEGIKVQCSLIDRYTPYIGFLKELINYIGIIESKGQMPILATANF